MGMSSRVDTAHVELNPDGQARERRCPLSPHRGDLKAAVWRRGMTRFVIPQLPGQWVVAGRGGGFLYRQPTDWLAHCVVLSNSGCSTAFHVIYVVCVLAKPTTYVTGHVQHFRPLGAITPYWPAPAPTTVADVEEPMLEVLELIRDQALPYFDQVGTLTGYTALAEDYASSHSENVNTDEELYCLQVIRGDTEAALRTSDVTDRAA
jgi:hypothetical protein